nr:hypothetical protein [Pandoravirus aubagnensis]
MGKKEGEDEARTGRAEKEALFFWLWWQTVVLVVRARLCPTLSPWRSRLFLLGPNSECDASAAARRQACGAGAIVFSPLARRSRDHRTPCRPTDSAAHEYDHARDSLSHFSIFFFFPSCHFFTVKFPSPPFFRPCARIEGHATLAPRWRCLLFFPRPSLCPLFHCLFP